MFFEIIFAFWIIGISGQFTDVPLDEPLDEKCYLFSVGRPERYELYSPNYPALYPNHSDCIRVIEASVGHTIKLDFRDKFSLEPSEGCKYDFLEVRDGGHGYDRLIGKWCGDEYPPVIESTSRWLWLRFKSDDNIEGAGFRAIWEEIPIPESETEMPEASCLKLVGGADGWVNRSDIDKSFEEMANKYDTRLECMWVIQVEEGMRIQLTFAKFQLAVPNDCDTNFVDIFPETTDIPSRLHNFCGSIADIVVSPGPILQVRFVAFQAGFGSDFSGMFTAFRDKPKTPESECREDEFDCEDATCIAKELRCNGRVNCRLPADEDVSRCLVKDGIITVMLNTEHMVIILVVFFLILCGMCCAFLYNCFSKLVRDHKIIKEQMRASREVGLDSPNLWETRPDSPETRESECQTRESVFSELGSLRPGSVESTKSAPDVIITH